MTKKDFRQLAELVSRAPSGHNTQPWLFSHEGEQFIIRPDFSKTLPVVDPDNRELYISLGCAAENLNQLTMNNGQNQLTTDKGQWTILFSPSARPIVNCPLSIVHLIVSRQTNRRLYNKQPVSDKSLSAFTAIEREAGVRFFLWKNGSAPFERLKNFVLKGNEIQMNNPAFLAELKHWIRYNKRQAETTRDGLSYAVFGTPDLPTFLSKTIMGIALKSCVQNQSDRKKIESSSHFVLFTTQHNTKEEWIRLGQTLQRFLLTATQEGIATAFLNQPCEVPSLADEIRQTLPICHTYPALLLRIGYAKPMPYSLRRVVVSD